MSPPSSRLVEALDPRVLAFQTTTFSLSEDLEWLDQQRAMRAPVGVILHSTRILEVLCREVAARNQLATPRDPLYFVLKVLRDYKHLPSQTFRLLDRLRDVGNTARHVLGRLRYEDAEQAFGVLLRGLHWYFCEYAEDRLQSLGVHNQPLDHLLPTEVLTVLALLEARELQTQGFLEMLRLERQRCPILQSPLLAAVLVERLLDGGRSAEAEVILEAALTRFPVDVRLRQLRGLAWSRDGQLEHACAYLEAIEATDSAADEETQGILAGAYKRRGEAEPAQKETWLRLGSERYFRGWRSSQERNTYLGINAAATGFWLGQADQAIPVARKVLRLMQDRRRGLATAHGRNPEYLNCWDQLTLAEAHLLLGQWEAAKEEYRTAHERFPTQAKALQVAREQAIKDLRALAREDLVAGFFS